MSPRFGLPKAVRPSEAGMNAASSLVATALSRMTRSAASKERSIVKTSLISASLVAILAAGAAASLAFGQAGGPGPSGQNIAVIDVGTIFEKHVRFKAQMDQLKAEIDATEKQWKKEAQDINSQVEELKTMGSSSPSYHQKEAQVAQITADFNVKKGLRNKELMERQGKIYFATYREVEDAVKDFCQRYNVALVIRYNAKPIDSSDPQQILQGIQRPIVYVDKRYDITGDIITLVNRSAGTPVSSLPQGVPH
jgi:Skp family chaperone for outer membrane proteins